MPGKRFSHVRCLAGMRGCSFGYHAFLLSRLIRLSRIIYAGKLEESEGALGNNDKQVDAFVQS